MSDASEWDPTGEVATELHSAIGIYGPPILTSPQLLANFFSDPFSGREKGASLLVTATESHMPELIIQVGGTSPSPPYKSE